MRGGEDHLWLREISQGVKVFLPGSECPTDSKERHQFVRDLQTGQAVKVRVIEQDGAKGNWIVSREQVLAGDPWATEVSQWLPGKTTKRLRVTNVHADWAFGEIIPGVEGRI